MLKAIVVGVSAVGFAGMLSATSASAASAQVKEKTEHAVTKTTDVITDSAITAEVKTKLLAAKKDVPGSKIEVDTTNGTVTLNGAVPTRAARAKAIRITRESKGVKRVVNKLTIGAS